AWRTGTRSTPATASPRTPRTGPAADPSAAGPSSQRCLELPALLVDQAQVTHGSPQVSLVDDADEGRLAGRGHPPDALDVVHDAGADRADQPVSVARDQPVRVGEEAEPARPVGAVPPERDRVAVGEEGHPGPRGVGDVVDARARRGKVE